MNPLDCCFPKPEIGVDAVTRVGRSCNCCNNNNVCCFPFFRRKRHHHHEHHHQEILEKVDRTFHESKKLQKRDK